MFSYHFIKIKQTLTTSFLTDKTDTSRTWFYEADKNEEALRDIPHRFRRYYLKQDGYARTSIHLLKSFDLSGYKTAVDLGGRYTLSFIDWPLAITSGLTSIHVHY